MKGLLTCCALLAAATVSAGGNGEPYPGTEDFHPDERPLAKTLVYDCNGFEFVTRLGPGEMALWLPRLAFG